MSSNVQQRAFKGVSYSIIEAAFTNVVQFIRAIFLTSLLAKEDFGLFAFGMFFAGLLARVTNIDFKPAFIQSEHKDEQRTAATLVVMGIASTFIRLVLIFALWPILRWFYPGRPLLPLILLIYFASDLLMAVNNAPFAILERQLLYRRATTVRVLSTIVTAIAMIAMAWYGFGIWALMAEKIVKSLVFIVGLYIFRPPWSLRWEIDVEFLRKLTRFTVTLSLSGMISYIVGNFDYFWIGNQLGDGQLGLYSRAYNFAGYPKQFLAVGVSGVLFAAFSRLKANHFELSQTFARVTGSLVRLGLLLTIILFVIAPQFIEVALGEQWLPMLSAFRLLVFYSFIAIVVVPLLTLFQAVGKPIVSTKIQILQLVGLIPAVVYLGGYFGIEGVAVAVSLITLAGFIILLSQARNEVDFSLHQLFTRPIVASIVIIGIFIASEANMADISPIVQLFVKVPLVIVLYGVILLPFEYNLYIKYARQAKALFVQTTG